MYRKWIIGFDCCERIDDVQRRIKAVVLENQNAAIARHRDAEPATTERRRSAFRPGIRRHVVNVVPRREEFQGVNLISDSHRPTPKWCRERGFLSPFVRPRIVGDYRLSHYTTYFAPTAVRH